MNFATPPKEADAPAVNLIVPGTSPIRPAFEVTP
jgi:hypothetical protein